MKKDFAFPNPIKRADLPKPRRRWRYIAAALGGLALLALVFLPQVLSSRIGRNLIKMYLENHYHAQVWITDWRTSWFGPTYVHQFSMTDPQGRQIKFTRLDTPLPMWKLLLGRYDLGNATCNGLHVEYVVDYGDGADSFDRLAIAPARPGSGASLIDLPQVSGHIILKNATFILTRGQIEQNNLFRTTFRSEQVSAIDGTLDVQSLDRPWTCDLAGVVGQGAAPGTARLWGTAALGAGGKLNAHAARADLRLEMQDIPNTTSAITAPLGWLLLPALPADDWTEALGPTLDKVLAHIQIADGKLACPELSISGRGRDGSPTRLSAHPTLSFAARPHVLGLDGALVADLRLTRQLAQDLAYVNPFLHDAVEGSGHARIELRDLLLKLGPAPAAVGLRGEVSLHDVTLASGPVALEDAFPHEPVTQYQAIVGDSAIGPRLNVPKAEFVLDRGTVSVAPYEMSIDGQAVALSGSAGVGGEISMLAGIALPAELRRACGMQRLAMPIAGTIQQPALARPAAEALAGPIDRHMAALRDRRIDRLLHASQARVKDLLLPYDRMGK